MLQVADTKLLTINLVIISKMAVAAHIGEDVCIDGRKMRD